MSKGEGVGSVWYHTTGLGGNKQVGGLGGGSGQRGEGAFRAGRQLESNQ